MNLVPTIDISSPDSTGLEALDAACRDHGFFLLADTSEPELDFDMGFSNQIESGTEIRTPSASSRMKRE